MIGMGVDLVQISQFEKQLRDTASVFVQETFQPNEIKYANHHASMKPARHLAARFATKEALIKAWANFCIGKPLKLKNPSLKEIEIKNDPYGRPYIRLHGQIKEHLQNYTSQVSISHDGDYAISTVILQEMS